MLAKCEWVMGKLPVKGRDCRKHGDRLPAGARAMLNHCRRCRVLLQISSAFWLLRANCAFAGCCQIPAASPVGFSASLAALGAVQGAVRRRCVWCVPPLLLYGGELCGMEMASSLALPCPGPGCWKAASLALHAATTVGGCVPHSFIAGRGFVVCHGGLAVFRTAVDAVSLRRQILRAKCCHRRWHPALRTRVHRPGHASGGRLWHAG